MILNVLYTFDNAYAPFAGVSLHSLLTACTDIPQISVYCVTLDVAPENLRKIGEEVENAGTGRMLHLIDGNLIVEKMKSLSILPYRNSYAPNLRLFFEEFFESDTDRLLYLDCDTIVTRSLKDLLLMDLGHAPAAVVRESLCGNYYKNIRLEEPHRYFNSGVILFTAEWKKGRYTERLLEMMQTSALRTMNPDQDYLNLLLKDDLILLPPKYNFQPMHTVFAEKSYFRCFPKENYYSAKEIKDSANDVAILHTYRFCGQFPWHKNSVHPSAPLWLEQKNQSAFRDLAPVPNAGFTFAIERMLYRLLPKGLFLKIFTFFHRRYSQKQFKNAQRQKEHKGESELS